MRALVLLLILAGAFGLAALWQRHHLAELQAAQRSAEEQAWGLEPGAGETALAPGEVLLLVGRPSGAEPRQRPADPTPPVQPNLPEIENALDDFTQQVQPGQTLSGIAHLHYGRSGPALVAALAAYNGLDDADALRVGQVLKLPPPERLQPAGR